MTSQRSWTASMGAKSQTTLSSREALYGLETALPVTVCATAYHQMLF